MPRRFAAVLLGGASQLIFFPRPSGPLGKRMDNRTHGLLRPAPARPSATGAEVFSNHSHPCHLKDTMRPPLIGPASSTVFLGPPLRPRTRRVVLSPLQKSGDPMRTIETFDGSFRRLRFPRGSR